ncbi:hypothetical protein [Glaciecola sp. MF2-115]|uniref:hypothetical protein n=1 Tax=Glaciecola sp. MF2-115 TaxID=3384827 RepID=UPI0039A0290A
MANSSMFPKLLSVLFFVLVVVFVFVFTSQAQIVSNKSLQVKPTPDPVKHAEFLLKNWDQTKPTLVAFKDPRCPYCIKAFKNMEVLDNYNVFVFWAPILGTTSQRQVDTFFKCEHPLGDKVISAVLTRKQVSCEHESNEVLRSLNDEMVHVYDPRSVPQYWYGNEKTWISRLKLATTNQQRIQALAQRSAVKIPWNRYEEFRVEKEVDSKLEEKANLAIVANRQVSLMEISTKIKPLSKQFNVFLFSADKSDSPKFKEFIVLNDIAELNQDSYFLEGKKLSKAETDWMLSL